MFENQMFANPIKGSVGGTCKRLAGIIHGLGFVLIIAILILSITPIFTNEGTIEWLADNINNLPKWLQNRISHENSVWYDDVVSNWFNNSDGTVNTLIQVRLFWSRIGILILSIWNVIKSWIIIWTIVLGLNIIGDWTNSLVIIANKMPKVTLLSIEQPDDK